MGISYLFKCPECDFEVICSRRIDRGFTIEVQPMYCSKCKVVKDIHIGNYVYNKFGDVEHQNLNKVCKKCDTGEFLQEWDCHTCTNCGKVGILFRDIGICWD